MGFLPQDDSRPSLLLDEVRGLASGAVITYDRLYEVCGINPLSDTARSQASTVIAQVNRRLLDEGDWRQLFNSPRIGYRVGSASELRVSSLHHVRGAGRRLRTAADQALAVTKHPDATHDQRQKAAEAATSIAATQAFVARKAKKVKMGWPR